MDRRYLLPGLLVGFASLAIFHWVSVAGDQFREWQVLSEAASSHATSFNSLVFFDELNGLGLTALGLESTTDGGKTWSLKLGNNGNHGFYSMWFDDRHRGWILGTQQMSVPSSNAKPLMLRTSDGGATWNRINLNDLSTSGGAKFTTFSSMCFGSDGKAWIVGDAGIVEGAIESDNLRALSFTSRRALLIQLPVMTPNRCGQ